MDGEVRGCARYETLTTFCVFGARFARGCGVLGACLRQTANLVFLQQTTKPPKT